VTKNVTIHQSLLTYQSARNPTLSSESDAQTIFPTKTGPENKHFMQPDAKTRSNKLPEKYTQF